MKHKSKAMLSIATLLVFSLAQAQTDEEKVLNLYSSRHYQTDEKLYTDFTAQTGIKINRIDGDDNGILERLKSEGTSSPADVILLADASRLAKGEDSNLFNPFKSKILQDKIPKELRSIDKQNGNAWFGFSKRARVIIYNTQNIQAKDVDTYEKLANPINKGKLCTRSASHPYMLSLFSSIILTKGEAKASTWAKAMAVNLAKAPKGGDTDQIRSVASGECGVALSNSYYYARLMRSTKPEDQEVIAKTTLIWPDQQGDGTHMNISGGGIAKYSPHTKYAQQFLEYLASDKAQQYFADGNNEWPVVKSVKVSNIALNKLGDFKAQNIDIHKITSLQTKAQQLLDIAGYK
jgi:iron(III) transport system substrate-binding protein